MWTQIHTDRRPCRAREKTVTYKPRSVASKKPSLADALISDFQLSELGELAFLLFKPPRLWCFVTAGLANQYNMWQDGEHFFLAEFLSGELFLFQDCRDQCKEESKVWHGGPGAGSVGAQAARKQVKQAEDSSWCGMEDPWTLGEGQGGQPFPVAAITT